MQVIVETKDDQETYDGEGLPATESDIIETKDWIFDWHKEYVYPDRNRNALSLKVNVELQAMLSYVIDEGFILIKLIETAPENNHYGGLRITPPMLAVASQHSYDHGFEGYTVIHIKHNSKLISYYEELGAEFIRGDRMVLETIASDRLIQLYLKKGER
ncbi:hypothetical protein HUG20_11515 [Salicibibacter cibi]|uniref:GNAT family N-acetyltransferase n=1 Tax=Salicibibacter cibi TaxID=2743001 RepID=A0A7T7CFX1_9BACI|nr:hypothetical protein [Salicibibacter cibi]QQK80459.1 hypothetical protein HUG20_11515 [Salicibibacter cibi]